MRNRPAAVAANAAAAPEARLRWLAVGLVLPLAVTFVRLAQVQSGRDALLTAEARALRSVVEPIPARDGRILSADGRVLAEDVERFAVSLHYRWLQEPPDPRWLRREALRSLTPAERRDKTAVTAAETQVEARRLRLRSSLAEVCGLTDAELQERRAAVQRRIAGLRKSVERRRDETLAGAAEPSEASALWWEAAWRAVRLTLTTPPRRDSEEPLVLAEEIDFHPIADGLRLAAAARIEARADDFPGVRVRLESGRRYPLGATAAHLVGYRFPLDAAEPDGPQSVGQMGLERAYDRHLRGVPGRRQVWFDGRGEVVRTQTLREPRVGVDLVLHLHAGLQGELEQRLDAALAKARAAAAQADAPMPAAAGGCVIVLDVRSGAVLAAASAPRFDLSAAARRDPTLWRDARADPARPLFDRATRAALPPGSVFKPVVAAAAVGSGRVDPDEPFDCVGYLSTPDRHRDYVYRHYGVGHGPTTLASALAESCNVYFFQAARRTGAAPLLATAARFGFGRPTGVDLPGEAAGHLPDPTQRHGDALGLSIGQADLLATPLQIVRMTAAVATGRLVTPHLVAGSGPARMGEAAVRPLLANSSLERVTAATLAPIRDGLRRTVADPRGTGYKTVRHPEATIAGKTGTAEVGGGRPDHAWFAGYAPADDPQLAFVVLLEHAGSGGSAAGPLARATVESLLRHGLLPPNVRP